MRHFTSHELSGYNGKNGAPIYIAYKGHVYDVSGSFTWKTGNHQVLHDAGRDLTERLEQAPHGSYMLERFPVVGILREDD